MNTTIDDYPNVHERAQYLGLPHLGEAAFLPRGFDTASTADSLIHEAETATLRKLLRAQGVVVTQAEHPTNARLAYIQKSAELLAPTIFVGSQLISQHFDHIILILRVLEVHARLALRHLPQGNVRLTFVVETSKKKAYKKLTYEGPSSGIQSLSALIAQVSDDLSRD